MDEPRLLTDAEVEEIRMGLTQGLQGPVIGKWARQLLGDHDARVRLGRKYSPDGLRARYGEHRASDPDPG